MLKRSAYLGLAVAIVAGCSRRREEEPARAAEPAEVTVDGSSTVFPMSRMVADRFTEGTVAVAASGTRKGFEKLCAGAIDITGASRPIQEAERQACRAAGVEPVEHRIAHDGIAVVVSRDATWVDHLTVAELRTIWEPAAEGRITRWSQVRPGWPDEPLVVLGPGPDSGTYDHFTEVVVGTPRQSRRDATLAEDDEVIASGVAAGTSALGYFGFAYYHEHRDALRLVPVDAGRGPVTPSEATILDGSYAPLSRPLFIYTSDRAQRRPEVARFVDHYLAEAGEVATTVGYVPLRESE
jgi:phosphate transport system substrate-binding protein